MIDDDDDVGGRIVVAAKDGQLIAHVAQRIHDERDRATSLAALRADLTEQAMTIIERPAYDDRRSPACGRFEPYPRTPMGLDEATQKTCAGHAASISAGCAGPRPVYGCTYPRTHGHHKPGGDAVAGPMTEEEKQDRRSVIEGQQGIGRRDRTRRVDHQMGHRRHGPQGSRGVSRRGHRTRRNEHSGRAGQSRPRQ